MSWISHMKDDLRRQTFVRANPITILICAGPETNHYRENNNIVLEPIVVPRLREAHPVRMMFSPLTCDPYLIINVGWKNQRKNRLEKRFSYTPSFYFPTPAWFSRGLAGLGVPWRSFVSLSSLFSLLIPSIVFALLFSRLSLPWLDRGHWADSYPPPLPTTV